MCGIMAIGVSRVIKESKCPFAPQTEKTNKNRIRVSSVLMCHNYFAIVSLEYLQPVSGVLGAYGVQEEAILVLISRFFFLFYIYLADRV